MTQTSSADDHSTDTSEARPRRIGIGIIIAVFGIFGLWSVAAPLKSAALAPGKVTVDGQRKSIEHLEGGLVAAILVKDGDTVATGDVLLRLDATQARAQLEITRGQLYTNQARAARLQTERDDADTLHFPSSIAGSDDPRAHDAMAGQTQLFAAARRARLGEIDILQQKKAQLREQITGTQALIAAKQALNDSYLGEIHDFSTLLQDGFADKQHLRELERRLTQTEGERAESRANLARQKIEMAETQLQMLQLNMNFHSLVIDELSQVEAESYDLQERMRAAFDRANRTSILAPVGGVVVGLTVTTIGEVIKPGEAMLFIVPQHEQLIVQARVNPMDIDRVHSGQAASIRFSAFRSASTPIIEGIVVGVSADALSDQQNDSAYYLARIELTVKGQRRLAGLTLVPGMPVEVLINTGSRTLYAYLTQPIRNAFARSLIED